MREFERPSVIVSKCLGFAPCRWNGLTIPDAFVERLKPHVDFRPVCPEVEIGLGVPRDLVRMVTAKGSPRLRQPATGADVTRRMEEFAASFLGGVREADGFLLKSRSPSCGLKDVKVYPGLGKTAATGRGAGLFGAAVLERFSHLAVEDEGRLSNFRLREHYLIKLFCLAAWRRLRRAPSMRALIDFQAGNKFLLMAYGEKELRALGKIVANPERRPLEEVLDDYARHLGAALARPVRYLSAVNALMHALGYVSQGLSAKEKALFLDYLGQFRARRVPLSVPIGVMKSWIVRFEEDYLRRQTFFEPYPLELAEVTDSGKGREL